MTGADAAGLDHGARQAIAELTLDDDETEERLEALHLMLPSTMRKLTNGYELRTFWWEIFECLRKISLIAVPILFKEGSIDQLTSGLVICFVTFSMYTAFAPFISYSDDVLSIVCQLQIFFTLLSAVLKQANPESVIMSTLMPIMILIPPITALVLEFPWVDAAKVGRVWAESEKQLKVALQEKKDDEPFDMFA